MTRALDLLGEVHQQVAEGANLDLGAVLLQAVQLVADQLHALSSIEKSGPLPALWATATIR